VAAPEWGTGGLALSRLGAWVWGRTLTIRVTLSEPAAVTIAITRMVRGRVAATSCRADATRGGRCTIAMHALTLRRHGKRGVNTFIIRLPRMPAAHCIATMTARDAPAVVAARTRWGSWCGCSADAIASESPTQ
jgi:hypothetical protein